MDRLWQRVADIVQHWTGIGPTVLGRALATGLILLAYAVIGAVLNRLVNKRITELSRRYIARKVVAYILGLAMVLAILATWLGGLGGMVTYLGLLSAGVIVALAQPLVSLVGWFYIMVRKPLTIGDRIQIGPHIGDVVDISLFRFSILEVGNWVNADQSTGRIIHIPNAWVFTQATANYTQGFNFIWNELPLTVTYQSNWHEAKRLLVEIGRRHSATHTDQAAEQVRQAADRFLIHFEHLAPIVWTSATDKGIVLTLRYLCEPRQRRSTEARIWEELLRTLPQHADIHLAFAGEKGVFGEVAANVSGNAGDEGATGR